MKSPRTGRGSPSAIELLSLECHAVHVVVALAVEVLAGAVVAVAVALHVADGGHGVGGRAHGVRVAEAVLKLDLVLVPVPPQDSLHLCPQTKQNACKPQLGASILCGLFLRSLSQQMGQ